MGPQWMARALQAARDQAAEDEMARDQAEQSADAALDRLALQLGFVLELDRAKTVLRRSYLTDASRLENDAEHMWHVMLAGLLLAEHADEPVDPVHVALMLAVHDVVEIDAGDTFIYDETAIATKSDRERLAADRIFGLLPPDQGLQLRQLWEEFETRTTPEARLASAIDRLLPLLMNLATGGRSWREHGIAVDRVRAVNSRIALGSTRLWAVASEMLANAEAEGLFGAPA